MTIAQAASLLRRGMPVAAATDTVYGLCILPGDGFARRRLYAMKRRPPAMPMAALFADMEEARRYVRFTAAAKEALRAYPPGAVTVIVPLRAARYNRFFYVSGGALGVRFPASAPCRALIRACGGVIQATSANISGEPPARTAEEITRMFNIPVYGCGGTRPAGKPSAVIDCTEAEPRVIRA